MYEYKVLDIRQMGMAVVDDRELEKELNKLSDDGWELVTAQSGAKLIFRRPKNS